MYLVKLAKKSELRCKSVRMDNDTTGVGATSVTHIWKWSPQRDIKIRAVFMCLDLPDAQIGTAWCWASKGAVDMEDPADEPNEEEMIFASQHITSGTGNPRRGKKPPKASHPDNVREFFNFGENYVEVEDGESVVLSTRQPDAQNLGIGLIIYYTT